MAEINGVIRGPNLTLSPLERAWVEWLQAVQARLGTANLIHADIRVDQVSGWVDGFVNVGIRAPNGEAWREEARRVTGGRIEADGVREDSSTGEWRGEVVLRARFSIGKPVT